jgi:hypothetical protein
MQQWSEVASVRSKLETELEPGVYQAAWERGKILDLETVVKELLVKYDAQNM